MANNSVIVIHIVISGVFCFDSLWSWSGRKRPYENKQTNKQTIKETMSKQVKKIPADFRPNRMEFIPGDPGVVNWDGTFRIEGKMIADEVSTCAVVGWESLGTLTSLTTLTTLTT